MTNISLPKKPWSDDLQDILKALEVDQDNGLDETAISQRRDRFGRNRLREAKRRSALEIFFE